MQTDDSIEFQDEPDEDQTEVPQNAFSNVVLNSSDWTTETILSQLKKGNIDLRPNFQRRDAWTVLRKSRFIESLILGLPIPQIVLAERSDQRGSYIVLDGKQRLLSLLQFTGNAPSSKNNEFELSGLEVRRDLVGMNFDDLKIRKNKQEDLNTLLNQTIRTVVLRNWKSNDFLHMVFLRLNTSSVALSPQELRQALFPGPFTSYVEESASASDSLRNLLKNPEPDFRMRDVELLVRYFGFRFNLANYSGNLKLFMDETCGGLNKKWQSDELQIKEVFDDFELSLKALSRVFGTNCVGRKWNNGAYETRLNRAVLDAQLYYFKDKAIRVASIKAAPKVTKAFKQLCADNADFRSAVETTTKSLPATYNRLHLWGQSLQSALGKQIKLPTWDDADRRIVPSR